MSRNFIVPFPKRIVDLFERRRTFFRVFLILSERFPPRLPIGFRWMVSLFRRIASDLLCDTVNFENLHQFTTLSTTA